MLVIHPAHTPSTYEAETRTACFGGPEVVRGPAVGSFCRWAQAQGWVRRGLLAGIERRPQPRDEVAPIRYQQLHALWTRADIHVREKTLWRMLYETAARANEILALDVEDLDVGARRAVVRGKGGHRQEVVWASGTARLLPRYLSGRGRGPVFVTHRRPNVAPALVDVCPDTGRGGDRSKWTKCYGFRGVRRGRCWPWGGGVGLVKSYRPEGASPTNEHAQR